MAVVIVQSDFDPKVQIRIANLNGNEWGGKCPRCRNLVSICTSVPTEFLGRDLATQVAVSHLDAGCGP